MAGKFCTGYPLDQYAPRIAKAFCEGRKASADGALRNTNPFDTTIERENEQAWDNGWVSENGGDDKGCCAV